MSVVRLIRMGRSGDNLESGDFSYGRRRTFISSRLSAIGKYYKVSQFVH